MTVTYIGDLCQQGISNNSNNPVNNVGRGNQGVSLEMARRVRIVYTG